MTLTDSLYFKDIIAKDEGHTPVSCVGENKTKKVFTLRGRSQYIRHSYLLQFNKLSCIKWIDLFKEVTGFESRTRRRIFQDSHPYKVDSMKIREKY